MTEKKLPEQKIEGYEVENDPIKALLRKIASRLKIAVPEGWGFTLFLFSFGEQGATFYISNAQREDMLNNLSEFMGRNGYIVTKATRQTKEF